MSLRKLPRIEACRLPSVCAFQPDETAIARWDGGVAAAQEPGNTISILDVIGEDYWTGGGVTSKRVAAALRSIGSEDVYVDINSPGGDLFEGVAIYNLLREHPHNVTVRILGLAASAASVIAMAGDQVQIGKAGFMMIHDAWVIALGNRHDLADAAATLEVFDDAMASVYADRTRQEKSAIAKMMDDETWLNGEQAVDQGFADDYLSDAQITEDETRAKAISDIKPVLKTEIGLRKAGMSRSESRSLIGDLMKAPAVAGTPSSAVASTELADALSALRNTLTS